MQDRIHEFLKFVRFRDIENWSVQYAINNQLHFGEKFELQRIGTFLSRNKTPIIIEDDKFYKRVTIKMNNGGCCLRDIIIGKQIGTKLQFLISAGQFILSKIDARNGAMGVVPLECDNAIITGNFWTFDVDRELVDSGYLSLVTTTKEFIGFAETASNGTTNRHYLQEPLFLDVKIPLPTLEKQQELVKAYSDRIRRAESLERQTEHIEKEIEKYLLETLGISITNAKSLSGLNYVRFKDVVEWGYDRLISNNKQLLHSTLFQNKLLSSLLEINPKTSFSKLHNNDDVSFIPMECISDKYGKWVERRTCKVNSTKGYTKFINGDLLWARITPCMQNGKSAIVDELENGCGCGSTEFHVLRNHNKNLNLDYVHSLLRLPIVLKNAMKSFTGSAGQQRVPKSYLENLSIPVPPYEVQNAIVEHINEQKTRIKELKKQAEELRTAALVEFEKEIFI